MSAAEVIPLGERLKHRREELGLSQAQAARELDVARTAYRLWEMEAAKPAPDRWRLIARWLGVSIATMLLAEELIDASEAAAADTVSHRRAGRRAMGRPQRTPAGGLLRPGARDDRDPDPAWCRDGCRVGPTQPRSRPGAGLDPRRASARFEARGVPQGLRERSARALDRPFGVVDHGGRPPGVDRGGCGTADERAGHQQRATRVPAT